jgi:hypothetical protein
VTSGPTDRRRARELDDAPACLVAHHLVALQADDVVQRHRADRRIHRCFGHGRGPEIPGPPWLQAEAVEALLEAPGVRLLRPRQGLEPLGDLVEASSRAVLANPGYICVYS